MKWLLAGFLAAVLAAGARPAAAQSADPNQAAFEAAMQAATQGKLSQAIVILEALAGRTDAPRVRLELARTLYMAGEYRRAKAEFLKVYRRDLPYPVRRTINLFLDDIDQRIGYLRPELAVVGDSNPRRTPPSGTYRILGAPLDYRADTEAALGLGYRLSGALPIGRPAKTQWLLTGTADVLDYPGRSPADYGVAAAGLRRDDHGDSRFKDVRIGGGVRWREQPGLRSASPYVDYYRRLLPQKDRQISMRASVELNRYAERADLNGVSVSLAADYRRDLGPATTWNAGVGGTWSSAEGSVSPRTFVYGEAGLSRSLSGLKLDVVANASIARADYEGIDPFFGEDRHDLTERLDVAVYRATPVLGLFPGVVASVEHRESSIDFYGYDRTGLSMVFRRRF